MAAVDKVVPREMFKHRSSKSEAGPSGETSAKAPTMQQGPTVNRDRPQSFPDRPGRRRQPVRTVRAIDIPA